MDDKTVNIVMKMILSQAEYEKYKAGMKLSEEQMDKIESKVKDANKAYEDQANKIKAVNSQMQGMREKAEKLQTIGTTIGGVGLAAGAALLTFANKYVTASGQSESASREWLSAMKSMENSEIRVGRVIATQALPYLEKAAKLASDLAGWAEEHPEIIDAALKLSAAAVVAGGGLSLVAQGMKVAGSVGQLLATPIAGGSAEAAAAGALGGTGGAAAGASAATIGSVVVPVALMSIAGAVGGELGTFIVNALTGKNYSLGDAVKAVALSGPAIFETLQSAMGGGVDAKAFTNTSQQIDDLLSKIPLLGTNELKDQTRVQKEHTAALTADMIIQQQLIKDAKEKALVDERQLKAGFSGGTLQIQQDQAKALKDLLEQQAKDRTDIETKGADDRAAVLADLATQSQQAEADYLANRAKTIQDGNLEIERLEQDSKKRLEQLEKEHDGRVTDLTASRDALGLAKENRDYADKRQQEIDNTNTEVQRRRADIALRLKDLDRSYQVEQQRRQEAANLKLKQITDAETVELNLLRDKQAKELQMQADHYKQLLQTLTDEYEKQLVAIKSAGGAYETTNGAGRASGGPVTAGMPYLVGEQGPEIFNPRTSGSIIPNGPTAAMLNPRSSYGSGNSRSMNVRIETPNLVMLERLNEMDKRFKDFERGQESIFAE